MNRKMVDYIDSLYESYEQHGVGHSYELADTMIILKEEIRSCKEDNEKIMQGKENQEEVNVVILQSLSKLQ